jgi:two-component system sporulation sensor kinase B
MAVVKKGLISLVALISFIGAFFTGSPSILAASGQGSDQSIITEWQMLWEQPGQSLTIEEVSSLSDNDSWFTVHSDGEYPSVPEGIDSAWIRFRLPELTQMRPALTINKLYAKEVIIYLQDKKIYERTRKYSFDLNEILLPIEVQYEGSNIYLYVENNVNKLGIYNEINVGEFTDQIKTYVKADIIDIILGASLVLISFFMIVSVLFINRTFQPGWYSLFLVMLSVGVMILSYSSFMYKYFPEYITLFNICFDIASSLFMPALFFFLEQVLGRGPFGLITKFKKIQTYFAVIYTVFLGLSFVSSEIHDFYYTSGFVIFGLSIIVGNILLISSVIFECKNRNKEAIILAIGISIFAGVSLVEVIWYMYIDRMYDMKYWKVSILFFLASLIIILARKVMVNYQKALQYSKQIEIFNEELQRSEKIELISNLAASIAHEVRNPLQVTRGFLQLLGQRLNSKNDKSYVNLAINELDRASEIITDFLTFAKPDIGKVVRLNIQEEISQLVAILAPLATLQGGIIKVEHDKELFIIGSSSRFKQALMNIIKNSIEACGDGGEITIKLSEDAVSGRVIIKVRDNGEGIDAEDLKRLGEPYYTNKTKGTGLGLMVTFRIIEAMDGSIKFISEKGIGTEVNITLPSQ